LNERIWGGIVTAELFITAPEAQLLADRWCWEYNTYELHSTSSTGRIRPSRGVRPERQLIRELQYDQGHQLS